MPKCKNTTPLGSAIRLKLIEEKHMEQIEQAQARDHEHLERTLRELPLTYTLREEFLRVTSLQTNKIDKLTDMVGEIGKGVAALTAREDKS